MAGKQQVVSAQVVLRSATGRSPHGHAITAATIGEYLPSPQAVGKVPPALAALEPRSAGRPPRSPTAVETQVRALEQQLLDKDLELRTAQARAEIALALPQVRHEPPAAEKKTPPRARRRRGPRSNT